MKKLNLIHPGEILLTEFMEPLSVSQNRLARDCDIPLSRIYEIIHGKRNITADTAYRLSKFFGNSAEFWLNLQNHYDLECVENSLDDSGKKRIKPLEKRERLITVEA